MWHSSTDMMFSFMESLFDYQFEQYMPAAAAIFFEAVGRFVNSKFSPLVREPIFQPLTGVGIRMMGSALAVLDLVQG